MYSENTETDQKQDRRCDQAIGLSGYLIRNKRKILLLLWERTIIKLGQIIS